MRFSLLNVLMAFIVVLLVYFLYTLEIFENKSPTLEPFVSINPDTEVELDDVSGWNPAHKIIIYAKDDSGIKSYKIRATTADGLIILDKEEIIATKPKSTKIQLPKPNISLPDGTILNYDISITDWSNANFFRGNTTKKKLNLTINTQKPTIDIIASSGKINQGGSALVVFKIKSIDIKELEISNGNQLFTPFPFLKKDHYAVILAWPVQNSSFIGTIKVTDSALNSKKTTIPLVRNPVRYSNSTIKLKEEFLATKMDELINDMQSNYPESVVDNFDKFKYINENVRLEDEALITQTTTKVLDSMDSEFHQIPQWQNFAPLKGYVNVGKFGDKRTYLSQDDESRKSLSLHLGVDIASVKNDQIFSSNDGRVILAKQLGVYGNTLLVDHGYGLSTLYSHLDNFGVLQGDEVNNGSILGLTGQTGWAFGDHLHFGVLIQGMPVRCAEWADSKWVKESIMDVFEKAKAIIEPESVVEQESAEPAEPNQ